jgi:hypothetical protein
MPKESESESEGSKAKKRKDRRKIEARGYTNEGIFKMSKTNLFRQPIKKILHERVNVIKIVNSQCLSTVQW